MRADAINQRQNADKLRSGVLKPSMVRGRFDVAVRDYQTIPFADADPHFQAEAVKLAIYQADGRARAADAFADGHSKLCDAVHGLALKQVQKPEAPPPINVGNKRKLPNGRMAEASSVRGAMVRWQDEKGFVGRSSSRAWRGFAAADPTA